MGFGLGSVGHRCLLKRTDCEAEYVQHAFS